MEDGLDAANMGATSNINVAKLATLQERKKSIEETLAKCTQSLRELCIQEADLTGVIPTEMPLEPGESLPSIRRRVGTAYQLPENLIQNSNKDQVIADLELQIQIHANMAEAALGLAKEHSMSKTVRRKHKDEYEKHKKECMELQLKLENEKAAIDLLQKQKLKKQVADDNLSVSASMVEPFVKSDLRHSLRSLKHSISSEQSLESKYSSHSPKLYYRPVEQAYVDHQPQAQQPAQQRASVNNDDSLSSGVYRISLNGYKDYLERMESVGYPPQPYMLSQQQYYTQPQHRQMSQHNSPLMSSHSPHMQQQQHSPQLLQRSSQSFNCAQQLNQDYNKYNNVLSGSLNSHHSTNSLYRRQSSPNAGSSNPHKLMHYTSHTIYGQPTYRHHPHVEAAFRNPHQIQPHQQYEQNVMASGLGGCWKRSDTGEQIWCNSNTSVDADWPRDKRFGSLDRRKNKRLNKRISPSVDNKSATISVVPTYPEHVRTASVKSSQILHRRSQDNRQLVRTQSLGSVGAQTIDSVYPSDDNSSFDSDNRSINDVNQAGRKPKEKEWVETSLDSSPETPPTIIRSHLEAQSILAPEEKYQPPVVLQRHSPPPPPPPLTITTPKAPLEIPAESNPSPKLPDTNLELFNNNFVPKNCTVVQAGHCKPYHEETKPFEMSDFYKYSTKFKKSPVKQDPPYSAAVSPSKLYNQTGTSAGPQKNLNEYYDGYAQVPKPYHYTNPNSANNSNVDNSSASLNSSLDLNGITVAENFSAEMNAWYKDHEPHRIDNNNSTGAAPNNPSKSRSTATLV